MNHDREWHRVRIAPGKFACNRYSWLRPADSKSIVLTDTSTSRLVHVTKHPNRPPRTRAPRVDEAQAVLDVQFVIDDLHPLDRHKISMARYYFHPDRLMLDRCSDDSAKELQIIVTSQHLGVRHWWACPDCSRRARYLYAFRATVGDAHTCGASASVLACRECLGLTYASRSQHRCPGHDEGRARRGDLKAALRTISRIDKKTRGDLATLEAIRKRLYRDVEALGR